MSSNSCPPPTPNFFDHHLNQPNDKAQILEILGFIRECQQIDPHNPHLFRAEWRALLQLDLRERVIKCLVNQIHLLHTEAWAWALLGEAFMEVDPDIAMGCLARSLLLAPEPWWKHPEKLMAAIHADLDTPLTRDLLLDWAEFSTDIWPME